MVRDALRFVLPAGALALVCAWAGWWFAAGAFLAGTVFLCYFFRNPRRDVTRGEKLILAPADGTVLLAAAGVEEVVFQGGFVRVRARSAAADGTVLRAERADPAGEPGQLVSIFMGLLDVHVNRSPVDGVLESVEFRPGRFRAAFRDETSTVNAQNILTIRGCESNLVVKQIAGVLARRVVCWKSPGQALRQGEVIGLIRFGSRVDVLMPENVRLRVRRGQRVRGGVTVLGEYP